MQHENAEQTQHSEENAGFLESSNSTYDIPEAIGIGSPFTTPEHRSVEDNLKDIFTSNKGVLGIGRSGVVLKGTWEGTQVAIKTWNRENEEGYQDLCREIRMCSLIETVCPQILGSSVPRVLLKTEVKSSDTHHFESVVQHPDIALVTEFVGVGVKRNEEGKLNIIDGAIKEAVGVSDEAQICAAAVRSLFHLHENGILHGDVALRNLRVEKYGDKFRSNAMCWRACWIDLGKATYLNVETDSAFRYDMQECSALFRGDLQLSQDAIQLFTVDFNLNRAYSLSCSYMLLVTELRDQKHHVM